MKNPANENRTLNLSPVLRQRVFLVVLIAVIPAVLVMLQNAQRERDSGIARIRQDAQRIVENAAARQTQFIDATKHLLTRLAETAPVQSGSPASCGAFMKGIVDRTPMYADLGVIDADGRSRCSAMDTDRNAALDEQSHFQRARDLKSFAIGDYQTGQMTGKGTLSFGFPILRADGELDAVVYAALDHDWLSRLYKNIHLNDGASLTLVDSRGIVLARLPEPGSWLGKPVPDAPSLQILQQGARPNLEITGPDGIERDYAFRLLGDGSAAGHLYAIVAMRKDVAFAEANRTLLRNLAWLALAALSALAAAWIIGNAVVVNYVTQHANAKEVSIRLAAIVESSGDAIIGMTLDGRIISWNDGAEIMYGYTAEETRDTSITILNPPDRSSELPQILTIIKQGKGINRFESERIRKDGRRIYVSSSISPIRDHQGQIVGAAIIARDITALRKVDEQLRAHAGQLETLCQAAQEVGGTLALEEVLRRALRRVASASGFEFAFVRFTSEVGGRTRYGTGPEGREQADLAELCERLGGDFERKLQATSAPWLIDDMMLTPDLARAGVASGMKAVAVLPLAGNEQRTGVLVLLSPRRQRLGAEEWQFLQALSQQVGLAIRNAQLYATTVQMNADLQGEIEERKRAEKILADFTAMIVHDLRSPLSNVVSIAESLQDGLFGQVSEQQSKWLWKIESNCKSLITHVSDFLDLSKIEAGRMDLIKTPVDLETLLRESLLEYSIQAEKKNISLKSEIGGLPTVYADARRLAQVMSNLISNALKFTGNGGALRVGAKRGEDGAVTICVEDTGAGISADEIAYIFETYRQAAGGRQSSQKGTGLGLAICKKIVEAHGGKIWVESSEGKGSAFFFSLPAGRETARESDFSGYQEVGGAR